MALAQKRPMLFALPQAGWKEYVSLPKLGLGPLVAKLDTGARSAALHADGVKIVGKRVTFTIENDGRTISHTATLHSRKRIKSSNGQSEDRPVIETPILMGGTMFLTEITLTRGRVSAHSALYGAVRSDRRHPARPSRDRHACGHLRRQ